MLLPDANVLVYAGRPDSERHHEYRTWLEDRLSGPEPFGISEMVLGTFVRLTTNHRIYRQPTSPEAAVNFCDSILAAPAAIPIRPGMRHWTIFTQLCRQTRARGNDVPDAYLAALAIEHGATLVSVDRALARFPGLRLERPLA